MPLTDFQRNVLALLAGTRAPDSYLAGGAALHFEPNSTRYSNDLDFFHDSEERVASAFAADRALLAGARYQVSLEVSQPGHVRALVAGAGGETRIDWAHDSAWRFKPPVRDSLGGFLLHPIDLAVNKALTLAGRDEPRDYVDILFVHDRILGLGALCWAAAGNDPGFTPLSLLELLKRRGRHQQAEIDRLDLAVPRDVKQAKQTWLGALETAEDFIRSRPAEEVGSLYWFRNGEVFGEPSPGMDLEGEGVALHWGTPGGVLPQPSGLGSDPSCGRDRARTQEELSPH